MRLRYPIGLIALSFAIPSLAGAQALTSLQSVSVSYNTRKATVRPTGELKTQIDEIDRQIAEARRLGHTAQQRRLMAKGTALLSCREWTDASDYANSIVIRTEHLVADSARPYELRLEQLYTPDIELARAVKAHAVLRKRPVTPTSTATNTPPPPRGPDNCLPATASPATPEVVKDLGTFDGVARDLDEAPYRVELDVRDVPDGMYQLAIEVLDDARSLGTATLLVSLRKGIDDVVAQLEAGAKSAPESLRADILFPVDRLRNVNRGLLELRTFDPDKDFPAAQAVLAAVKTGKNPFVGKTGDFKRHYTLESANEILPYHMYVPTSYDGSRAFPLIIALHGLGGTEDSFFDGYDNVFPPLAEQHRYIVASPLGYRVDGGYGWGVGNPPADPTSRQTRQRSEDDVMQVLQIVKKEYKIDESRIYLMGHSLGAIGTWLIAPKYPDLWAAIGPISGQGQAASLERIRNVPEIIIHGDDDRTVNVQGSRAMVAKLKELGTEFTYIEVPGGSHSGVVPGNLAAIFDFFDAHKKPAAASTGK